MGLKREKCPISLGLEGEFSDTLKRPPLNFSDDQFAPLIEKLGKKLKNCIFIPVSNCSLNF